MLWSNVQQKHFHTPMLKILNICACTTHDYSFIHTTGNFQDMVSVGGLHWYPLINEVTRWHHEFGHVTFPGTFYNVCNLLVQVSTFEQVLKLTFGRNKFGKRTVQSLQTRIKKKKKSLDQVDESLANFIYQKVSQCKFQTHIIKKLINNI